MLCSTYLDIKQHDPYMSYVISPPKVILRHLHADPAKYFGESEVSSSSLSHFGKQIYSKASFMPGIPCAMAKGSDSTCCCNAYIEGRRLTDCPNLTSNIGVSMTPKRNDNLLRTGHVPILRVSAPQEMRIFLASNLARKGFEYIIKMETSSGASAEKLLVRDPTLSTGLNITSPEMEYSPNSHSYSSLCKAQTISKSTSCLTINFRVSYHSNLRRIQDRKYFEVLFLSVSVRNEKSITIGSARVPMIVVSKANVEYLESLPLSWMVDSWESLLTTPSHVPMIPKGMIDDERKMDLPDTDISLRFADRRNLQAIVERTQRDFELFALALIRRLKTKTQEAVKIIATERIIPDTHKEICCRREDKTLFVNLKAILTETFKEKDKVFPRHFMDGGAYPCIALCGRPYRAYYSRDDLRLKLRGEIINKGRTLKCEKSSVKSETISTTEDEGSQGQVVSALLQLSKGAKKFRRGEDTPSAASSITGEPFEPTRISTPLTEAAVSRPRYDVPQITEVPSNRPVFVPPPPPVPHTGMPVPGPQPHVIRFSNPHKFDRRETYAPSHMNQSQPSVSDSGYYHAPQLPPNAAQCNVTYTGFGGNSYGNAHTRLNQFSQPQPQPIDPNANGNIRYADYETSQVCQSPLQVSGSSYQTDHYQMS